MLNKITVPLVSASVRTRQFRHRPVGPEFELDSLQRQRRFANPAQRRAIHVRCASDHNDSSRIRLQAQDQTQRAAQIKPLHNPGDS